MLQVNCFILTAVLFTDVNCGIFLVITLGTFMLPGRRQSDAYSIYHVIPTDTCYPLLPDHHTYVSILWTDLTISLMHWCLVTIRSLSFWCTTAISIILHWVSIENSWIYTIVINVMKSKKLMGHCFCHYWMFDAQIGLSHSFRKMRLNYDLWCLCQLILIFYGDVSFKCLNIYFSMPDCCMNDWLLWYLYLFTLTCSSFFVYWDLLNPNRLLNWTELHNSPLTFLVLSCALPSCDGTCEIWTWYQMGDAFNWLIIFISSSLTMYRHIDKNMYKHIKHTIIKWHSNI